MIIFCSKLQPQIIRWNIDSLSNENFQRNLWEFSHQMMSMRPNSRSDRECKGSFYILPVKISKIRSGNNWNYYCLWKNPGPRAETKILHCDPLEIYCIAVRLISEQNKTSWQHRRTAWVTFIWFNKLTNFSKSKFAST